MQTKFPTRQGKAFQAEVIESADTEERQSMKPYLRNLCISVCLGHGLYDDYIVLPESQRTFLTQEGDTILFAF